MVCKTAGSLLVVFLYSVTASMATRCGQKSQVVMSPDADMDVQYVTLTCLSNCSLTNATYIWYRNGQRLVEPTSRQHTVKSYYTSSYFCSVKDLEDLHSPTVCVRGRNCFDVTYAHQRICALKGSTVDLPCKYRHLNNDIVSDSNWYIQGKRDEAPTNLSSLPEYSSRVKYLGDNMSDCTLRFTDLRETDSAEYKFRFKTLNAEWGYSFPGTNLTVTDIQVKVTPATEEGKVNLTCITSCPLTDNSNTTYIWYKNGQHLTHQKTMTSYLILDPDSMEDRGRYSCGVKGLMNVHSPKFSVGEQSVRIGAVVGITVVVVILILLLSGFIWFSKKASKSTSDRQDKVVIRQRVHVDTDSDTYTTLNMRTMSPDYDTLDSVHADTNSDLYTTLNMRTMSSDYDTLAV
uniref:Ig-like domain-containing protein n=1 Tax=Esox lucius TaxID=8010 RepID=A0A6Q2WXE8_ESOLU